MHGDVTRRDPCATPPVDLYVAGFPCQAYSMIQSERGVRTAPFASAAASRRASYFAPPPETEIGPIIRSKVSAFSETLNPPMLKKKSRNSYSCRANTPP